MSELRRKTLSTRLITGVLSQGLYQVVAALSPIFLVPLFLRAWGVDKYGHWVTLTAVVSGLSLVDLGGRTTSGIYWRKIMQSGMKRVSSGA